MVAVTEAVRRYETTATTSFYLPGPAGRGGAGSASTEQLVDACPRCHANARKKRKAAEAVLFVIALVVALSLVPIALGILVSFLLACLHSAH